MEIKLPGQPAHVQLHLRVQLETGYQDGGRLSTVLVAVGAGSPPWGGPLYWQVSERGLVNYSNPTGLEFLVAPEATRIILAESANMKKEARAIIGTTSFLTREDRVRDYKISRKFAHLNE